MSFRNHFRQKTVYLNTSISDDWGSKSPPPRHSETILAKKTAYLYLVARVFFFLSFFLGGGGGGNPHSRSSIYHRYISSKNYFFGARRKKFKWQSDEETRDPGTGNYEQNNHFVQREWPISDDIENGRFPTILGDFGLTSPVIRKKKKIIVAKSATL